MNELPAGIRHLVKHHDESRPPPEPLTQEQVNVIVLCSLLKPDFDRTGNPIWAFQAYDACMRTGLYPPLWALEHIHAALRRKFERNISFDSAFGFSAEGMGKGRYVDPLQQRELRGRNRVLCLNVFNLEAAGLSRTSACRQVAAHYVRHSARNLSAKQISNIVKSNEQLYAHERAAIISAKVTDDQRRQLLKEFDAVALVREVGNR